MNPRLIMACLVFMGRTQCLTVHLKRTVLPNGCPRRRQQTPFVVLAPWSFKAGKSTSRLECVLKQQILNSGSKKLGQQSKSTNFGTLPCVSITSANQDAKMATTADSDTLRLIGSPTKDQRKVAPEDQLPS